MHGNLEQACVVNEVGRGIKHICITNAGLYVQAETDRRPTASWVAGAKHGLSMWLGERQHPGDMTKATSRKAIYK